MIRIIIDADPYGLLTECATEAVAERLADLGGVKVVDAFPLDKPKQGVMAGFQASPPPSLGSRGTCPRCGAQYTREHGPEGTEVDLDIKPRAIWPDPHGQDWAKNAKGEWVRVRLDGDKRAEHTVGFPIHKCDP